MAVGPTEEGGEGDMSGTRVRPAGDRPGRHAWLGPISLCLAVLSWPIPIGGMLLALGAIACGTVSMTTLREYRIDWTAVVGVVLGCGQALLSLMLLSLEFSAPA